MGWKLVLPQQAVTRQRPDHDLPRQFSIVLPVSSRSRQSAGRGVLAGTPLPLIPLPLILMG